MIFQLSDQNSEKRKKKRNININGDFFAKKMVKVVVKGMKFSANIFFAMREILSTAFPQWH